MWLANTAVQAIAQWRNRSANGSVRSTKFMLLILSLQRRRRKARVGIARRYGTAADAEPSQLRPSARFAFNNNELRYCVRQLVPRVRSRNARFVRRIRWVRTPIPGFVLAESWFVRGSKGPKCSVSCAISNANGMYSGTIGHNLRLCGPFLGFGFVLRHILPANVSYSGT